MPRIYISPLFKNYLADALKQAPDKIFIFSAKYGILNLDVDEPLLFLL
jgi:hypothetical protein